MRRMLVVLAAITLITSGCFWNQPGFDASGSNNNWAETGLGVNNVASLHTRWSAAAVPGYAGAIIQSDVGLIDVSDGTTLTALDPATGTTVWSITEPSGTTMSGPTGDGNDILVTTHSGNTANLEVLDARTGATVSTTPIAPTGGLTPAQLTVVSGATKSGPWVVTSWIGLTSVGGLTLIGGFQVTNLDNPALSWRFDPSGAGDLYGGPVIMGDRLYLSHSNGGPLSFNSTVKAWSLSGCTNQCAPLFETPKIASGPVGSQDGRAVYAGTSAGFAALDPATGATQWEATIAGNSTSQVFATTDNAEVLGSILSNADNEQLAVYPKNCAAAPCAATWTTSAGTASVNDTATVANGVIYAALDPIGPSPASTTLAAYPLDCTDGCQPLWTMPIAEEVMSGPIVSNGQVLYGTASGKVVALGP